MQPSCAANTLCTRIAGGRCAPVGHPRWRRQLINSFAVTVAFDVTSILAQADRIYAGDVSWRGAVLSAPGNAVTNATQAARLANTACCAGGRSATGCSATCASGPSNGTVCLKSACALENSAAQSLFEAVKHEGSGTRPCFCRQIQIGSSTCQHCATFCKYCASLARGVSRWGCMSKRCAAKKCLTRMSARRGVRHRSGNADSDTSWLRTWKSRLGDACAAHSTLELKSCAKQKPLFAIFAMHG